MEEKKIHIGDLIKEQLALQKRSVNWLAEEMGKDGSNFSKQLKKCHLGTDLITQIGKVLNVNFFEIIGKMKN
ncbi:MAG: XRE family transcriptional regulator [Prevotellaceae bacterium]|jgi:hypothetical protein|nr:XRE family transcriptional regulator [Prevotellaceae bacterium]